MSGLQEPIETDPVSEAVRIAKDYVRRVFASDGIKNVGLEEVVKEEDRDVWQITVGFSRPWDEDSSRLQDARFMQAAAVLALINKPLPRREYKVVTVDMTHRYVTRVANRAAE